jgi:hypothetical protein
MTSLARELGAGAPPDLDERTRAAVAERFRAAFAVMEDAGTLAS